MFRDTYNLFSRSSLNFHFSSLILDKNLTVSISGDVDEAKALSKPPEDSQGTQPNTLMMKQMDYFFLFLCECVKSDP